MTSEQDIRNEVFKRQTGTAPNFRAIDGVGPKTAEKVKGTIIEGEGRVQAPTDVQDLTDDELAKKAGISQNRARKVIKGAGGNPDRKPRSTTGSVSAAGIRVPVGEFRPEIGDNENAKARFETSLNRGIGRSQNAAIADKSKRAPVTTDLDRWKENKGELDFPGVDTPSDDPQVLPKDLRQEQRPATTDPPDPPQTRTQPPETPSTEKGTQAPEPLTSGLFTQDVSLSPEEAFEGVGRGDPGGATGVEAGARVDEQRRLGSGRPPDIARGEDPFDMTDDGGALSDQNASEDSERREKNAQEYEFSKETLAFGKTFLNEEVGFEGRDQLEPLRQKVSSGIYETGGSVELTPGEFKDFQRVVRDNANEQLDTLEGKEATIMGDAERQRKRARQARQEIFNTAPDFGGG